MLTKAVNDQCVAYAFFITFHNEASYGVTCLSDAMLV